MNKHPSFQGLYYIIEDRLMHDGIDAARAELDAGAICDALWRLSATMQRDDIPRTIELLRDPQGIAARLMWLGEEGDHSVAS